MQLLSPIADWLAGGIASAVAGIGGVVYRNRERSLQNQHRLEGDPENPSDEGVMQIVSDTRERVISLEDRMDREHREVMRKLEDMNENDRNP